MQEKLAHVWRVSMWILSTYFSSYIDDYSPLEDDTRTSFLFFCTAMIIDIQDGIRPGIPAKWVCVRRTETSHSNERTVVVRSSVERPSMSLSLSLSLSLVRSSRHSRYIDVDVMFISFSFLQLVRLSNGSLLEPDWLTVVIHLDSDWFEKEAENERERERDYHVMQTFLLLSSC